MGQLAPGIATREGMVVVKLRITMLVPVLATLGRRPIVLLASETLFLAVLVGGGVRFLGSMT